MAVNRDARPGPEIGEIPVGQTLRYGRETVVAKVPQSDVIEGANGNAERKNDGGEAPVA